MHEILIGLAGILGKTGNQILGLGMEVRRFGIEILTILELDWETRLVQFERLGGIGRDETSEALSECQDSRIKDDPNHSTHRA